MAEPRAEVAAGIVSLACDSVARRCGISRAELLATLAVDEVLLSDPEGMLDAAVLVSLLRFVERLGEPAIGVRLARVLDLREQGFWGYAVLSASSLRERVETNVRYQRLRAPWQLELRQESGMVTLELIPQGLPRDVTPILVDWILATALLHVAAHLGQKPRGIQVCLSYPARHRELEALFEGELVFDAPRICLRAPVATLGVSLPGDPHLNRLARRQLDARLEERRAQAPRSLVERVRERVGARIGQDASLTRIARDLRVSARTLQRQLDADAITFHGLVEDVRRELAVRYLGDASQSVFRVARRLGYADASSFRRAFRRWTGLAPTQYRARQTAQMRALTPDVPRATRKVSGA